MTNRNSTSFAAAIAAVLVLNFCAAAQPNAEKGADAFWAQLQKLCGKAYGGALAASSAADAAFTGKALVMHVRSCTAGEVRIPFVVGGDRSRTWVLTKKKDRILLKHDHRHADGKPDKVTMYGGWTTNTGTATRAVFPADQETADMLPAAAGNVWWFELVPGEYFSYNLRRIGTDRHFAVRFDLTKTSPTPPAPWGWTGK